MSQTLEAFAEKHQLQIVLKRTVTTTISGYGKGRHKVEWEIKLLPPLILRWIRVQKAGRTSNLVDMMNCFVGDNRKQVREKLLDCIRGGVLMYSNEFDRAVGMNLKIKVPKNIR